MPRGPQRKAGVTGNRCTWRDEVCRIQERNAPIALVAACGSRTALRTCTQDIAVRKKATVYWRPILLEIALVYQTRCVETLEEVLRELMIPS
jgi:hypothetical protein